jgi:hypothetical protein
MSSNNSPYSQRLATTFDDEVSEDDSDVFDMKDDDSDEEMDENFLTRSVSQLSDLTPSCKLSSASSQMSRKRFVQNEDEEAFEIFDFIIQHSHKCTCLKNLVSQQEWITLDLTKIHNIIKTARTFVSESFNEGNSNAGNNAHDYIRNLLRGKAFPVSTFSWCFIFFWIRKCATYQREWKMCVLLQTWLS